MSRRRRSYEPGHRPKFLVVVDETPECGRALLFGARRAQRTGAGLVLLAIVPPLDDAPPILGVEDVMEAEAIEEAQERLGSLALKARTAAPGVEPEEVVRLGDKAEALVDYLNEDQDVAILVLAAGTGSDGPGPLVSLLATKSAGLFPVPIAIVPGHLADEDIAALA